MMRVVLNPDDNHVRKIQKALEKNGGFCPCMFEKSDDTRCKCKEFQDQVEQGIEGPCHCGLWIARKE